MTHWPIILPARTTGQHTLVYNPDRLATLLRHTRPCDVTLILERLHATRTARQNRAWWRVVIGTLCEHTGYTADEMHEIVKLKLLSTKYLLPHAITGEVVEEVTLGGSTRKLDKMQFNDLIKRTQEWAAVELGLVIPDPDMRLRTVEDL